MNFWDLSQPQEKTALVHGAEPLSYSDLQERINQFTPLLNASKKSLGWILCRNHPGPLTAYLAALQKGDVACLVDAEMNEELRISLISHYLPDWIYAPVETSIASPYKKKHGWQDYTLWENSPSPSTNIHPDLALLLPTSGTTGSPKMVRLSHNNLQSNAEAIAAYLKLKPDERPITTLPMHYSFGLSVINSHLASGATILMTDLGFMSREFWTWFRNQGATSLAGVPYTYHILHRLKFGEMDLPSLNTLTQAGGRLDDDLIHYFHQVSRRRGYRFYVMYGQTEATARISYLDPKYLPEKKGSIGRPIPGGQIEIDQETGELIYQGPNVMMGYAETRTDLARGDELGFRLRTGDLARKDKDGFYYITGRARRFLKLFGLRINLDEVERYVESRTGHPVACVGNDTVMTVICEGNPQLLDITDSVIKIFNIHPTAVKALGVDSLPRSGTGKIDYPALNKFTCHGT